MANHMAIRLLHATLGLFIIVGLAGCKEGVRQEDLPPGQCLIKNAEGRFEVVACSDGQVDPPDASEDSTVGKPDATPDATVEDAGPDALVLPMNACLGDVGTEVDAGPDAGSTSALEAAQAAAENFATASACATTAGGFGDAFITCMADAVKEAVPALSDGCSLCYGDTTRCIAVNCVTGGDGACQFANPSAPTEEELVECGQCRCAAGCFAEFDTCSGFSTNDVCLPPADASVDATVDASVDASADAAADATVDATVDGGVDGGDAG